ncbi:MAG: 50S ribosomal protein L30 [Spirochaetaceae bacterium]|nr:MAG: 50S ribosomal protein L30 [Spirochaetaceae bacterium]
MAKKVRITLVKSPIGRKPRHVRTVEALGLRKLHHSVEKEASDSVMGMVRTVSYLLRCEEIS